MFPSIRRCWCSRKPVFKPTTSIRGRRAIYFNDDVSIGYVLAGDVLEMTALDPRQGVRLYTMDVDEDEKPTIARRDECLQCHQGPVTLAVQIGRAHV